MCTWTRRIATRCRSTPTGCHPDRVAEPVEPRLRVLVGPSDGLRDTDDLPGGGGPGACPLIELGGRDEAFSARMTTITHPCPRSWLTSRTLSSIVRSWQLVAPCPWRSTPAPWQSPNWRQPRNGVPVAEWIARAARREFASINPGPNYVEFTVQTALDRRRSAPRAIRRCANRRPSRPWAQLPSRRRRSRRRCPAIPQATPIQCSTGTQRSCRCWDMPIRMNWSSFPGDASHG